MGVSRWCKKEECESCLDLRCTHPCHSVDDEPEPVDDESEPVAEEREEEEIEEEDSEEPEVPLRIEEFAPPDGLGDGGVWEDPPMGGTRVVPLAELALIDANPGRWRRVRFYDSQSASSARARLLKRRELDLDLYEVKVATLWSKDGNNRQSGLYVRRKESE